jgi:hypothetical protein
VSSSESSPAIGAESNDDHDRRGDEPTLEIPLEHARWRNLAWAAVSLVMAIVLIFDVGHTAVYFGLIAVAFGAQPAAAFVRTLIHPAGTIALRGGEVVLPEGLCTGRSLVLPVEEVRHAYFLRRSLPVGATSPILVIETARGTMLYPRDWFASDGDQRRIATSLNRRLGRL